MNPLACLVVNGEGDSAVVEQGGDVPEIEKLKLHSEGVSVVPCLLLILETLIAFQKMFPQNCKKVKSTNKEHHKQDQSQNGDSILPNQRIISKEGLHIHK